MKGLFTEARERPCGSQMNSLESTLMVMQLRVVVGVLVVGMLAACGSGAERRFLNLGSAPPGGAFFVVGGALAEVLNAHGTEHNWQVTSEATQGTMENIRRLAAGDLDFALANAAITYFAVRGEEGWEQPYAMRSVMTLAPNVGLFLTLSSSDVTTLAAFKGQRVLVGPPGSGMEYFIRPILAEHGVTYDDFTPLTGNQDAAVDMLGDGSAAAAFLGGAVPTASITQASSSLDVFFIPYDEVARRRLIEQYPFFHEATIPAGTYRNQADEFPGLNVGSMHFITSADADEALVYEVTKTLYENREAVVEQHPAGRAINPTNVVRDTGTEFHPGAIRYYREIGIWPEETPQPAE
jgi:TRAP transporter TAXI family solute receptor